MSISPAQAGGNERAVGPSGRGGACSSALTPWPDRDQLTRLRWALLTGMSYGHCPLPGGGCAPPRTLGSERLRCAWSRWSVGAQPLGSLSPRLGPALPRRGIWQGQWGGCEDSGKAGDPRALSRALCYGVAYKVSR